MRRAAILAILLVLPPARAGASRVEAEGRYRRQLEAVDASLHASDWAKAEKALSRMLDAAVDEVVDGPDAPRLFGLIFTLRAVAAAGHGDRAAAEYWWWSAQGIWPEARGFNLGAFGDVGRAVEDLGVPTGKESGSDGTITLASGQRVPRSGITLPRRVARVDPRLPVGVHHAAAARRDIEVGVTCVIDEEGRITRPWLPPGDLPPAAVAAVLDALAQWKYEPARLDGIPQAVFIDVKVRYHLGMKH